jgi:hypothetical protein
VLQLSVWCVTGWGRDGDVCWSYRYGVLQGAGETVLCAAVTVVVCYSGGETVMCVVVTGMVCYRVGERR